MSTNRELFFKYKKQGIPDSVINFALEQSCNFNNQELLTNFDSENKDENQFVSAMERYQKGEMIEYIFNKAYFLNELFYVNKNVLIPRQETEQLVIESTKLIKDQFGDKQMTIVDLCTGSGVIGISLAKRFKNAKVILTDISKEALDVAKTNINNNILTNIDIYQGDMLEPLIINQICADVLLCNPPYIENIETIDKKTWEQEPHLALLANPSTLFYETVLRDLTKITKSNYIVCFEIGEDMEESLTALVKQYCQTCSFYFMKDIYNKTRFLFIRSKNN